MTCDLYWYSYISEATGWATHTIDYPSKAYTIKVTFDSDSDSEFYVSPSRPVGILNETLHLRPMGVISVPCDSGRPFVDP